MINTRFAELANPVTGFLKKKKGYLRKWPIQKYQFLGSGNPKSLLFVIPKIYI